MNPLDRLLQELEGGNAEFGVFGTERERVLERENRRLLAENARLRSQHDFAFRSWQEAVKRSGRLSADLEASRIPTVELARGTGAVASPARPQPPARPRSEGDYETFDLRVTRNIHEQATVVNLGTRVPPRFDPETAGTRVFRHSGGALVIRPGRKST